MELASGFVYRALQEKGLSRKLLNVEELTGLDGLDVVFVREQEAKRILRFWISFSFIFYNVLLFFSSVNFLYIV